MMILRFSCH